MRIEGVEWNIPSDLKKGLSSAPTDISAKKQGGIGGGRGGTEERSGG